MNKFFLRNSDWEQDLQEAANNLLNGKPRHDILVSAVRAIEQDESVTTVGYGGAPDVFGEMSLDAALMNGDTFDVGAVIGVEHYLPVQIARHLMDRQLHVMLMGKGAELFARACGLKEEPTLSEAQKEEWERNVKPQLGQYQYSMDLVEKLAQLATQKFGTVVMMASDGAGLSVATSTSGWAYKFPGRIGDTPIPGAGFYADSLYGACACTHTGEMALRAGTSRSVVHNMKNRNSVRVAVDLAIEDLLRLRTGVLRGLCIHAIDPQGDERVVAINVDPYESIHYQYWREGMARPERRPAEMLTL